MKTHKLGNSGLEVSSLAFGGNVFGWTADEAIRELIRRYVDSYGPVTVDDISWWTGFTKRRCRDALEGLDLEEVAVADWPGPLYRNAGDLIADGPSTERGDLALGVGRYRHPDDDRAARTYGRRVLTLREALRRRSPQGDGRDVIDLWRAGAVLDLVAGPESRGNYNAWYRAAHQSDLQLAELTVAEVRALQRRLVRKNGGSAIGRYQIIDDTLDGLLVPGGWAPDKLRRGPNILNLVRTLQARNKILGFICHAGWVAASAGICK